MSIEITESGITSKPEVHRIAVEYTKAILEERGITTEIVGTNSQSYLRMNNDQTCIIRGKSEEKLWLDLSCDTLNKITNSDFVITITNLESINDRHIYIMSSEKAIELSILQNDGKYIIPTKYYTQYEDNYTIITDKYDTLSTKHEDKKIALKKAKKEDRIAKKIIESKIIESDRMKKKIDEHAAFRADYERRHNIDVE